ncbi:MAG: 3-phosphoshikimate 1-carboxyvinyltransferase [Bacillota bacterium]
MKKIIRKSNLKGSINIPPSKSLSHRAIIAASLAKGESKIENIILSEDILATIEAMKSFGVKINIEEGINNRKVLKISGKKDLKLKSDEIFCNESGSTLRFLVPFFTLVDSKVTYTGKNKLIERPLDSYYKIFDEKGIKYKTDNNNLPLKVSGKLKPGEYKLAGDISSQFITGLMFVLPLLKGDSVIKITKNLESKGYVDLTLDVLKKFGIKIINNDYKEFKIPGDQKYVSRDYFVPGDYSQAAFFIVSNLLGNDISLKGLNKDSLQGDKAILDIVKKIGGNFKFIDKGLVITEKSNLKGIKVDVKDCPDLVPILAVLLSFCDSKSQIINAERLRIKESDRLKAISSELNKIGGNIKETKDGLIIKPIDSLKGGEVDSWNDHRIAMALSIASKKASGKITINNPMAVEKSYPHFYQDLVKLGGVVDE